MTNFIPIFPLGIVVYPTENLNLHIFEPRYKQLINECRVEKKMFGIPVVINGHIQEIGTLVSIEEITTVYDNQEMDVKTKGVGIFRMLEMIKEVPDKLYSGAIVNHLNNVQEGGKLSLMNNIVVLLKELHELLKVQKNFGKPEEALTSYDVAHHAALSLAEEYELLSLQEEIQRQAYLQRHLQKVIPLIGEMEQLKAKIKLNGHFKNIAASDFDFPNNPSA
jgi:uncharacterized protein